jgi:homoserine dehydrogenase
LTTPTPLTQRDLPLDSSGKVHVRVALLGFGTVGTGTYRMLQENRVAIETKVGANIEVVRIGIKNAEKPRNAPKALFTTDLDSIVGDPDVDVVIELMGGEEPARSLIEKALRHGKHVITANKELIAKDGLSLMKIAAEHCLDLHFEAAVGGGIPLIQPLKHQLAGNEVLKMMGILNGTTNYILTKMCRDGGDFSESLAEAQAHGYAEPDPTNDVEAYDVRYKLSILASIAFGKAVAPQDVYCEGITKLSKRDIELAHLFGFEVKLLGIVDKYDSGSLLARVHPTFLPKDHPLANVNDVYNALWIRGDFVGDLMFSGRGAGADPTGSAVVGDLIDVARNIRLGGAANNVLPDENADMRPIEDLVSRFYLRVNVDDQPSVLGSIATVLGHHHVSLAAMEMKVLDASQSLGEIVFLTHPCSERSFRLAVETIENLQIVREIANWIRVEGT